MRYTTLEQLQQAYAQGKLSEPLIIDNDQVFVYAGGECVFDSHPADLLEEALKLLRIPSALA